MAALFESVSRNYGATRALVDVSFRIARGETVALVGPNGCGKSTCLQLLGGILRPSTGKVSVMGTDPVSDCQVRRRIGYAGDPDDLPGELTVEEILVYVARVRNGDADAGAELSALLKTAQLAIKREHLLGSLSEGMRRKCAVLQAMIGSPDLLLLDEPTSGLDHGSQERFAELIAARTRSGATVILATHDFHLLDALKPRILLLDAGHLVTDRPLGELLAEHACTGARDLWASLQAGVRCADV